MAVVNMTKRKILFLLSVDTEEEFDWSGQFPQHDCAVENIQCLPKFQSYCDSIGIRPTYLVDYPVATTPESARVLRQIADSSNAEIGAHLHPWCNPPYEGPNNERASHVVNLPRVLIEKKIAHLIQAIEDHIGVSPKVFRTGRWGINSSVLAAVADAGFDVDSSIYPFYENEFFSCLLANHKPYWPSFDNPDIPGSQRKIFEIPVTAGFNRPNFRFWSKVHSILSKRSLKMFRPIGIAWQTNTLRKLYLSPELSSAADLVTLVDAALSENQSVIHMFLHSSTLLPGKNVFTKTEEDKDTIYKRISAVVEHLKSKTEIEFMTISDAKTALNDDIKHS